MTALVLGLVTRRGEETARDYVFRHFRRQHLEKFLPGLQKLGLAGRARRAGLRALSLSFQRAGRREDRLPARERQQGLGALSAAALDLARHGDRRRPACGVGGHAAWLARPQRRVARQARPGLRLHRHDGRRHARASKATISTTAGRSKEDERVRFAYGTEEMPRVDWANQPKLETANWPEERRQRTFRAYALEYLRTMLPTLQELLGADRRADRARPRRAPGRPAVPRGDGARHGPADRRRARRPVRARATSRAGCRQCSRRRARRSKRRSATAPSR